MKKKLRAIVDTNIFVSALIGGISTSKIVDAFLEGWFCLVTSELLIKELRRSLNKSRILPLINEFETFELILFMRAKAEVVTPLKSLEICRDPKDNLVLECASETKVDFIVTGDKDLLTLKSFQGIPIIKPKDFIKLLEK